MIQPHNPSRILAAAAAGVIAGLTSAEIEANQQPKPMPIVDTHQHLWDLRAAFGYRG